MSDERKEIKNKMSFAHNFTEITAVLLPLKSINLYGIQIWTESRYKYIIITCWVKNCPKFKCIVDRKQTQRCNYFSNIFDCLHSYKFVKVIKTRNSGKNTYVCVSNCDCLRCDSM